MSESKAGFLTSAAESAKTLAPDKTKAPGLILQITREGSRLFIQENNEPPQELGAESETKFFSKNSSDSLTFEFDDHGRVVRMVLHVVGRDVPLKRLEYRFGICSTMGRLTF